VIIAFESLQTAWEKKLRLKQYAVYHDALEDRLKKLQKYYNNFDLKPAFSLGLVSAAFVKDKFISNTVLTKYYIPISNSNTSKRIGAEKRRRNKSWKMIKLMPETGKMRRKKWSNTLYDSVCF
jgi:hypothetical protein